MFIAQATELTQILDHAEAVCLNTNLSLFLWSISGEEKEACIIDA